MDWNTMNEEEFGSILKNFTFKIEKQKGGPNNSNILQNWFPPQKLGLLSLISRNFKALRKILVSHAEYIEMHWTTKNLGLENF